MTAEDNQSDLHPAKAIRRFDVFAEYTRLDRQAKGYPTDEAKGYGIWLAKVVAARKFNPKTGESRTSTAKKPGPEPKFREIGDEIQTDQTFDIEIIHRMGPEFYKAVFSPAISKAKQDGEKYEDIRDSIRSDWKPEKRAARK
jgi:hypothetical protein